MAIHTLQITNTPKAYTTNHQHFQSSRKMAFPRIMALPRMQAPRRRGRDANNATVMTLPCVIQSLGLIYGDLGTSPLYVFSNTFPNGIRDTEDVIGALSLIIYSLTLIALVKYLFLMCIDNGQGGTFALYSLLCRHANIRTIPNEHETDEQLTTDSLTTVDDNSFAAATKKWLEASQFRKIILLILVLIGTCMVIGDGILTPAISVLSASNGIKGGHPRLSSGVVVIVAVVILVGVFSMQHFGTDKIGLFFGPTFLVWFLLIGGIGMRNIIHNDRSALKAFSPVYIYRYFRREKKDAWISLGGVMLCITGTEALYADVAHIPVSAMQLSFATIVYPCLLLAYTGQAAHLMRNPDQVNDAFYRSIPGLFYWPTVLLAVVAAVLASHASISASFSIIKQAVALDCFPRVKVVHTSKKYPSVIYIPDMNWIFLVLCIAVTAGFKHQSQIGNAYGTAVLMVMLVATLLMTLVMLLVRRCHWSYVMLFTSLSMLVECSYFSAVLYKIDQGVWVPFVIAAAFLVIMSIWHYGTAKNSEYERDNTASIDSILDFGSSPERVRVRRILLVYTELESGVPRIFSHFATNIPVLHSVVIFVYVKYLHVYTVPEAERFVVERMDSNNMHTFRIVARYGYGDLHKKDENFESKLFDKLNDFVRQRTTEDNSDSQVRRQQREVARSTELDDSEVRRQEREVARATEVEIDDSEVPRQQTGVARSTVDEIVPAMPTEGEENVSARSTEGEENVLARSTEVEELKFVKRCRDSGVVHILGHTDIRAKQGSSFCKKIAIDYIYTFLRKICRDNSVMFDIPHQRLLNVGHVVYL